VAPALLGFARTGAQFGVTLRRATVSGQPGGLYVTGADELVSVLALDIANDVVQCVRSVVHPDKLQHLGTEADIRAMLRAVSAHRRSEPPHAG